MIDAGSGRSIRAAREFDSTTRSTSVNRSHRQAVIAGHVSTVRQREAAKLFAPATGLFEAGDCGPVRYSASIFPIACARKATGTTCCLADCGKFSIVLTTALLVEISCVIETGEGTIGWTITP